MSRVWQCGNVSTVVSAEYREAMAARKAKQVASKKAAEQKKGLTFTSKGDFTHIHACGFSLKG